MAKYLMGIDNGGTMTKAAIFDTAGNEIATGSQDTPLLVPQDGFCERDMNDLWNATVNAIKTAIAKTNIDTKDIIAIGCTGHGKGLYLWGKDGKPAYNAITSTDRRALSYVDKWNADGTALKAREYTLQNLRETQGVPLLAWLKDNHPEVVENTQYIFEAKDFIRFMLTGVANTEYTDSSSTSLMNLKTMTFDKEVLKIFGLEDCYEKLPPLKYSYELCGTVTEEISKQTGLAAGTPVCGGMFDIDACAIAMDVSDPEKLCAITGTWSINEYISETPIPPEGTTQNSIFCIPGYYLIEESSPTSAGNLEWYIKNFLGKEKMEVGASGGRLYDWIDQQVDAIKPEDSNVIFLPFLYGTNDPKCQLSAFTGLNNFHTTGHLLRAIYEGVTFSHMYHIEKLLALRDTPTAIRMAGGATKSEVWLQMFADVIGLPIEMIKTKELGTLGCAMAGAVACGLHKDYKEAAKSMVQVGRTVHPNMERHKIYAEKFARYKKLIKLLSELY